MATGSSSKSARMGRFWPGRATTQPELALHQVPILGGPDEDDHIRERLAGKAEPLDGPSLVKALLRFADESLG
ncbi:MAG: hypothetical protein ACYDCQ_15945 [Dehalococcoidia bacterium]